MSFSLAEVEAMAKKAARGAGYSWGMAEEAAAAARWLCAHQLGGVEALAFALERMDGASWANHAPQKLGGSWQARAGALCPLCAGAALADSAQLWADEGKDMAHVMAPLLLLPFAAIAARQLGQTVTLTWKDLRAVTDGHSLSLHAENAADLSGEAHSLSLQTGGTVSNAIPHQSRAHPSPDAWAKLEAFAQRTYAPETQESRLKGAGAGLSDND